MTQKKRYEMSSVEREAEKLLEKHDKYAHIDERMRQKGYDVDAEGRDGQDTEFILLQPLSCPRFENMRRSPEGMREFGKDQDEAAYRSAISVSALSHRYEDRELYMTEWMNKLYTALAQEAQRRGIFGDSAPDEAGAKRFIKMVPCLHHHGMDEQRGVDCFVVFHNPEAFAAGVRQPKDEATYWNPEKDTVVNIDVTAFLGTKFSERNLHGKPPRADIFVDKRGSAINHYLRQAVEHFPERVGGTQHIRNADSRMHVLAQRILDAYDVKSGRNGGKKLDHLYSPEKVVRENIEDVRAERRAAQARAMSRKEREEKKKAERRAQSEAALARKEANKHE